MGAEHAEVSKACHCQSALVWIGCITKVSDVNTLVQSHVITMLTLFIAANP